MLVGRQPLVTIPLRASTTPRRHDDTTKTRIFASHFVGLLPAGGAALRAVAGVRIGQITSTNPFRNAVRDLPDPH
jgi:hypothetical protein